VAQEANPYLAPSFGVPPR